MADAGNFVSITGAIAQTQCIPGTYQDQTGQSTCKDATPGNFVANSGQAAQTPCLVGTYQPNGKATSCTAASPGNFVATAGQAAQTPCLAGTYQPNSGQVNCVQASPGFFVELAGATQQTQCPPGTTSLAGATICTVIPPTFNFTGFFRPIDNLPALNSVNTGSSVPIKFSLGGNRGLNILAAGSPASRQYNCSSSAPIGGLEPTQNPGSSGLSYDAASDTYTYVWKTDRSWAGTCRQLSVTLSDGTSRQANFRFR